MKGDTFIHRTNHAENFVKIGNAFAQDRETLSYGAKGLLVELLSRPVDWVVNLESLNSRHHGRDSIRKFVSELRGAGFIVACKRRNSGLYLTTEYHVFDSPRSLEQIAAICAERGVEFAPPHHAESRALASSRTPSTSSRPTSAGNTGAGKTDTTKTDPKKDRIQKSIGSKEPIPAADATGEVDEDLTGLNPGDLALLEQDQEERASHDLDGPPPAPSAPPAPAVDLALVSEDEPNGQTFPWRQLMSAVKRIVPEVVMPTGAARRDHLMKQFWRKHGKTVGCFEMLATKVAASDYLMARGGHTGNNGRPFSWGWIFSKNEKGVLRADSIMEEGGYSTEAMAFVLEKKAKEAAPKRKRVILVGAANPCEIDPDEKMQDGRPRYRDCKETRAGLPEFLDRGGPPS